MRRTSRFATTLFLSVGLVDKADATEPLNLLERLVDETTVDVGSKGDSRGDLFVFVNDLYDFNGAVKVGVERGYCVRIEVGKSWECTWTNVLGDGQIIVSGPWFDKGESTLVITGGTGKYVGVKGSLRIYGCVKDTCQFKYLFE